MQIKQLIFIVWAISLLIWQLISPYFSIHKDSIIQKLSRWGKNLGLAIINGFLSISIILPLTALASNHAFIDRAIFPIPDLAWLLLDILILDMWIYAWHRANHEIAFLWRFHQVHHYDCRMDVTTALRFHFGEVFLSAILRSAVIIMLGIPLTHVLIFESLVLIASLFQHSNIKIPLSIDGIIRKVIITPSIHFVHHHAIRRDTDSNYGTILSMWDRIFGSSSPNRPKPAMEIGLEGVGHDLSLPRLLLKPIKS